MPSLNPEVPTASSAASNAAPGFASPETPSLAQPTNSLTLEQRQAAVEAEIDRLQQWSMNDDPASLNSILNDLTNPDKEVRQAAIEAAKEFGSTNAIPVLKTAAETDVDLQEKIALLEAADFLSLPSLSFDGERVTRTPEQLQADAQARAQRRARRQAREQVFAPDPDSSTTPAATPR